MQAYQYVMHDTRTVIVLSIVALVLVLGIGVCIVINPLAAIGLAPIVVALAPIIRAIGGNPTEPDPSPTKSARRGGWRGRRRRI
jgi:hypothetical protein